MHQKVKLGLNSPGNSITKMLCQTCVEQGKPASALLQHTATIRLEIQCSVAFRKGAHAVGSCLLHSIGQVQMLVTESHQNRNELPCFCTLGLQLFGALEAFFLIMVSVRVASLSEETPWFLYSCKICLYNSQILAVIVLPGILLWRSNKMLPAASCAQPKSTTCNQSKRRTLRLKLGNCQMGLMCLCCSQLLMRKSH